MKFRNLIAVPVMALLLTSCVSKKQFDNLNMNYKQSVENLAERQREIQDQFFQFLHPTFDFYKCEK